ncbi:MAG: hypothetical protein A4E57_03988 [Syntrophorhabdaceae bacterium PtaU1.Bin034]|nr:MAG: hypothetical protein A4E57_03988 [Syntrophorhabdaceae bacterium PtaU1.Bin034]
MAVEPHACILMEHEADELVTTAGEGHDEGPRPAHPLRVRIVHETGIAEVNLGFLSGRRLDADGRLGSPVGELRAEIPLDGRIAHVDPVILSQEPPHLFRRHLLVFEEQSGELPWPCYWGITLAPMALKWGYTMALDIKICTLELMAYASSSNV